VRWQTLKTGVCVSYTVKRRESLSTSCQLPPVVWFYACVQVSSAGEPAPVFDILFDDGEEQSRVPHELVRFVGKPGTSQPSRHPLALAPKFMVGDKVEARYRGKAGYFPGAIAAVSGYGSGATYTVLYSDGEVEVGVRSEFIRLTQAKDSSDFQVGDRGSHAAR
jgi:hypothetical protein